MFFAGTVQRYHAPTNETLWALFAADIRVAFAAKGLPDAGPATMQRVHLHRLHEPPRPAVDDSRPLLRWRVSIDFVCHDVKFGSSASGVFEWPDKPDGAALDAMHRVLTGDALAIRGDSPDYADTTDVLSSRVEATENPADYPVEPEETPVAA